MSRGPAPWALLLLAPLAVSARLMSSSGVQTAGTHDPRRAADVPDFVDVAAAAGLTHRTVFGGADTNTYILETTGTGVAFLDYDNDGILDLMFANGATLAAAPGTAPSSHLYRGSAGGTFTDVTAKAGVGRSGWGQGIAVGDYDNDGFDDLYLTFFGRNILFRNNGDGTFSDVTARAGVAAGGWSTSAAWGDYDTDGLLDLYVARYIDFDPATAPLPGAHVPGVNCSYRGFPVMCGPRGLKGARDILYHNNGNGTFTDVTSRAGIDLPAYRGLGVVWGDYDNDGRPDIIVADDAQPNLLFHNKGNGTFDEVALVAGVAVDEDGRERAGMGIDFGDYDNDGWIDLAIGNFSGEPSSLYRNQRDGTFAETTWSSGIGPPTVPVLTWGTRFFDYDNDGWKDLVFANGHVYPELAAHHLDETYAQRALLFRNKGDGTFANAGQTGGDVWDRRWSARGLAVGDYNNDGALDLVVATVNGPPVLLQNRGGVPGHWLSVKLVGTRSNRDAIGARLTVHAGGRSLMEEVRSGGSYLSQSDLRVHIGLGRDARVDAVDVLWPGGKKERIGPLDADAFVTIKEGAGIISSRRPERR
jgi:enediyne biosynthesis protein E4